jgi:hypothetical protein
MLGALCFVWLGCGTAPPAEPRSTPTADSRAWRAPNSAPRDAPPSCAVQLSTVAQQRGSDYDVVARARNLTSEAVTLELPDRCPQGPVVFQGLPGEYDYYVSCAKGACAGPREPLRFRLDPNQEVELTAVAISPGGGNCNQPLAPGRYELGFALAGPPSSCAGSFAVIERH